jgi:hypothetical protein
MYSPKSLWLNFNLTQLLLLKNYRTYDSIKKKDSELDRISFSTLSREKQEEKPMKSM